MAHAMGYFLAPCGADTNESHKRNVETPGSGAMPGPYLPMQKVEKMRLRMSSAVVAPVMASMGRSAE